ncbi:unnamed protein product [Didymodactylos carnosus]|uniref:Translocation protein SEC62 n=1 Tax=Didymodactylos carnosus TaxID=1234261 RepID=A0A813RF13_9BILA|nr:unnamed protein product [Didymodactylos carnosus]CAF1320048.1 unnamed protein product [Didymodactylos carnosus]CAF3566907.1 unnamed protein product [Didymodactylos carnosus]CAF4129990.1 unnamed protein product [Didymodactylos carnosus]
MSDNRKKSKRRKVDDDAYKLTKIEKEIAKYLRFKCHTKQGMLMGTQVSYFTGNKAVECLIETKWSSMSTQALNMKSDNNNTICFSTKHDCVQMLRKFLHNDMFHRVVKIYKEAPLQKNIQTEFEKQEEDGEDSAPNTPKSTRQRKNKLDVQKSETQPETSIIAPIISMTKENDDKDKDSKNKNKKKFKFELQDEQDFIDSPNEYYVWVYDPATIKQYIFGFLLVIGGIGICLFPLWPTEVRTGVYYLSIVLAGLLGFLLSLTVIKYILFAFVWILTFGKIKFWLLPNLTADVGILESFVPLYNLEMNPTTKKKKDNDDDDDDDDNDNNQEVQITSQKETVSLLTTAKPDENESSIEEEEQDDIEEKQKSSFKNENKENTSHSSSLTSKDEKLQKQSSQYQTKFDEDFEVLSKDDIINEMK